MQEVINPIMFGRPINEFKKIANLIADLIIKNLSKNVKNKKNIIINNAEFIPSLKAEKNIKLSRLTLLSYINERYFFNYNLNNDLSEIKINATEKRISKLLNNQIINIFNEFLNNYKSKDKNEKICQLWTWQSNIKIADFKEQSLSINLGQELSFNLENLINKNSSFLNNNEDEFKNNENLKINLTANILDKTFMASEIYQLKSGSILNINLNKCKVLLNNKSLLTASIAQHQGKLQLTNFENLN